MIVDIDVRIGPNEMGASSPQRQRDHGRTAVVKVHLAGDLI